MTNWKDKLNRDPIPWLLENDKTQPAILGAFISTSRAGNQIL